MNTPSLRRLRVPSSLLGIAMLSGALIAGASPASAVEVEVGAAAMPVASGTVSIADAAGATTPADGLELALTAPGSSPWVETTGADGSFEFANLDDGDYSLEVGDWSSEAYGSQIIEFTVAGADVDLGEIKLLPYLAEGTMAVKGDPVVGNTLTITTSGWPSGTALTYEWGYSTGQSGGPIDGATSSALKVTKDQIGYYLSAYVTGTKAGFAPTTISLFNDTIVSTPKKAAAPAPVADSGDLGAFLVSKGSTPESQEAVGLPAGALNPAKGYTAKANWWSADSFVDVYLYSTPVFVGTFPVVNGVVQIDLSADLLSELGAGAHTLVLLGQSSGAVGSAKISLAAMLASTGVDPVLAFSASGLFLLLGAGTLLAARRIRSKA